MAGRRQFKRDYGALGDEWIGRRLAGEALSLKAFAAEKGVPYSTLRSKGNWQAELARRSAAISRVVEERTTIDHAAMRIAILQEREPLRELFLGQVDRWKEAMQEDKTKRLEFREVIALGHLLVKMAEVGAGLPKEHVARHDEVDDIVAVNRREMRALEGAVVELAKWKRERRKAKEAAKDEA